MQFGSDNKNLLGFSEIKQNYFNTLDYKSLLSEDITNKYALSGIYGNGKQLVNKNKIPSLNIYNINLNDNVWFYYDSSNDNICFRFKGDIINDTKDTLFIMDDKTLNNKIHSYDINNFTDQFFNMQIFNTDKFNSLKYSVYFNNKKISEESLNKDKLSEIYKRYLESMHRQLEKEINVRTLSGDPLKNRRIYNRISLRDINPNISVNSLKITSDNGHNISDYLSDDELLDIKWHVRQIYTNEDVNKFQNEDYIDKNNKNFEPYIKNNKTIIIEPIFEGTKIPSKSIIDLAKKVDRLDTFLAEDQNTLSKLFKEKLSFKIDSNFNFNEYNDNFNKEKSSDTAKWNNDDISNGSKNQILLAKYLYNDTYTWDCKDNKFEFEIDNKYHIIPNNHNPKRKHFFYPYIDNIEYVGTENNMKLIINIDFFAYQLHDKNGINFITDLDKLDKIDILYNNLGNKLNKTPEVEANKEWYKNFKKWLTFDDNQKF